MSAIDSANVIHTRIWREEPEPDNPFAAKAAFCHGYDVYGEMLGASRWVDMLYLLLRGEAPSTESAAMLELLTVALANPGPRDPSIHAAMCGAAGGSTAAASLMAALAVGAGRYGGARDVYEAMNLWLDCGVDLAAWVEKVARGAREPIDIWPSQEHPPGFDPHGASTPMIVRQLLDKLAQRHPTPCIRWLAQHRHAFEAAFGCPLALSGVVAAALVDLGFSARQGEMLYLLLRLPGAAAHALEQADYGFKRFPFYPVELEDDPLAARQHT